MDSWPAEHWLGLNWTLGRCTLQIEARHLWNLLEVKKFPDGGFCIYHKSSVSSGNRILLGVRVAQEAGLEVQSQQIRFLLKTLLLACLRLSSQMGTEERQLWFVTPPSNCRTLESGNYLIFFHCLRRERPLLWRLSFCHSGNHRLGLTGFFFFIILFLFLAVLGLRFCVRALSSRGEQGPLPIAVHGPLTVVASLAAEHRLQTRRLSNCGSRAQLLRGTWDPPRPGLEPVSPALAGRFSTTAPPGKPGLTGFALSMTYCLYCHMTASAPVIWRKRKTSFFLH